MQLLPPTNTLLTSHLTPSRHPTASLLQPSPLHLRSPTHCPKSREPHSHSLTHRCHTSLQIKFTLCPPLSKKRRERRRGGWDGGADIITRQQSTWLSSITPFYTHVSEFYQSSCIPKCKFVLKIKTSFRRTKEFLNCWLWEGLYYPQPWVSGIAIDSPHPFLSPLSLVLPGPAASACTTWQRRGASLIMGLRPKLSAPVKYLFGRWIRLRCLSLNNLWGNSLTQARSCWAPWPQKHRRHYDWNGCCFVAVLSHSLVLWCWAAPSRHTPLYQPVLCFCHVALSCCTSGSHLSASVMYEARALPPLTAGDIFALERLKAAGKNQLRKRHLSAERLYFNCFIIVGTNPSPISTLSFSRLISSSPSLALSPPTVSGAMAPICFPRQW